jgi:hypothetical protein
MIFIRALTILIMKFKKQKQDKGSLAFVGFFFLGFAIGILAGRWDAAPFLGLGLGFIASLAIVLKS